MQGRVKEFFSRDRKTLYMILSIVLISIFSLTIVYAALSVTLNIQGNAEVVASTWDVHLDNVKVTSGSVNGNAPTITGATTATFSTTLNMPGDFYEFTIDVVNNGSIDAMIDGVTKTSIYNESKYLNYIVEYQNGESINVKQLVSKNSFVRLKIRVEFRSDVVASDLPVSAVTKTLSFTVNYTQSDGSGSSVKDNGAEIKLMNAISGNGTETGDEVCLNEECFYVMYSDETTVTMLAKYNLYVGGSYSDSAYKPYTSGVTGKQDETMLGYKSGQTIRNGTTPFANLNYWTSTVVSYPAYVYNSQSILYNYVENYRTYLISLGLIPNEARLITYEELEKLGCSGVDASCRNAPSWVYATSYWSGSANDANNIWNVYSNKMFVNYDSYTCVHIQGVRPVIVIDRILI